MKNFNIYRVHWKIWFSRKEVGLRKAIDSGDCPGVKIKFICLIVNFWCRRKSHCSSPIATKCFVGAVSPLFDPTFTGRLSHFSYKEVPDLWKTNLFTHVLFNIILRKYYHLLPSCYKHPWNLKQNKFYVFTKTTFQEVTQCHCTQTLYKI